MLKIAKMFGLFGDAASEFRRKSACLGPILGSLAASASARCSFYRIESDFDFDVDLLPRCSWDFSGAESRRGYGVPLFP